MLKKLLFTAFLACFALSANAQIATPQLDAGFHTFGGAAAGWRYGSTVNLVGASIDGKINMTSDSLGLDDEEVGESKVGLNAAGPDDKVSSVPFLLAAYRGETFAGELYSNIGDGLKTDLEMDKITGVERNDIFKEEKELRLNLAYVLGDTISVGLGYVKGNTKTKEVFESAAMSTALETTKDLERTGTSLTASFRLADIVFVAAGMEAVNETGTYQRKGDTVVLTPAPTPVTVDEDYDYVENSWTNTLFGIGVITGDPGDTQFRAEYSLISSPESKKDADGDKLASNHPQTTTAMIALEVKYMDFLVAYLNKNEKEAEMDDQEKETVTSQIGLGWKPMEGLNVSLYSISSSTTAKDNTSGASSEAVVDSSGYRFVIGYNF